MTAKQQPRYCPNCLMMQGKARLLSDASVNQGVPGALVCDTYKGCGSQFTTTFLDRARGGMAAMLAILGIASDDDPKIISKGSAAEAKEKPPEILAERNRVIELENDDEHHK